MMSLSLNYYNKKYGLVYVLVSGITDNIKIKYSNIDEKAHRLRKYRNVLIYDVDNEMDYKQAIIDYISGMSDNYAIKIYKELTEF